MPHVPRVLPPWHTRALVLISIAVKFTQPDTYFPAVGSGHADAFITPGGLKAWSTFDSFNKWYERGNRLRLPADLISPQGFGTRDKVWTVSDTCMRSIKDDQIMGSQAEVGAEVVGAVTKAAIGVAVGRAAALAAEEQGIPRPHVRQIDDKRRSRRQVVKRVISNMVTFLRANESRWDTLPSRYATNSSDTMSPGVAQTAAGVMVNGYWFPSLETASHAQAEEGFDFEAAAKEMARDAVRAKRQRQRHLAEKRRQQGERRVPKGVDMSCGAILISSKPSKRAAGETTDGCTVTTASSNAPLFWRWTGWIMQRTGAIARLQRAIRVFLPRMSREALLLVVSVAGGELAKREIAAQVEALEEPVRGPAWALLNETYRNLELRGAELVQSDWDIVGVINKELADWKRRGVGNSYQEALFKEVLELQTKALLRPISRPGEEGSLMVQLNTTYRKVEEVVGKFLPKQTKEQLSLIEGVIRKLDDKGIGELSFDEVYRALLLGAVPPALLTYAVRLLAAGSLSEQDMAGLVSSEVGSALPLRDAGTDVTLAVLAARLNDTREVAQVMTYTVLAAETEAIDNLRETLDKLQVSIRKALHEVESELVFSSPPEGGNVFSSLQGASAYTNKVARSAVISAIETFNGASKAFDSFFEMLAEPSRRTLWGGPRFFSWQNSNMSAVDNPDAENGHVLANSVRSPLAPETRTRHAISPPEDRGSILRRDSHWDIANQRRREGSVEFPAVDSVNHASRELHQVDDQNTDFPSTVVGRRSPGAVKGEGSSRSWWPWPRRRARK